MSGFVPCIYLVKSLLKPFGIELGKWLTKPSVRVRGEWLRFFLPVEPLGNSLRLPSDLSNSTRCVSPPRGDPRYTVVFEKKKKKKLLWKPSGSESKNLLNLWICFPQRKLISILSLHPCLSKGKCNRVLIDLLPLQDCTDLFSDTIIHW